MSTWGDLEKVNYGNLDVTLIRAPGCWVFPTTGSEGSVTEMSTVSMRSLTICPPTPLPSTGDYFQLLRCTGEHHRPALPALLGRAEVSGGPLPRHGLPHDQGHRPGAQLHRDGHPHCHLE